MIAACLISTLYIPSVATRFDFIDDGNLVYAMPPAPFAVQAARYWEKVVGHYHERGPFRPVLWAHWTIQAQLLGPVPIRWRALRLLWTALAAAAMLALMLELGLHPAAAVAATSLAMWAPGRSEIWTSLTLGEGVAMPYAIMALWCAARAARSPRPTRYDIAGAVCALMALGCKNTFAAIVPAQLLLRASADDGPLSGRWRQHGKRMALLALTLLLPAIHYVLFKFQWHPGQYRAGSGSIEQLRAIAHLDWTAAGMDYLTYGLLIAAAALVIAARRDQSAHGSIWTIGLGEAIRTAASGLLQNYRRALRAGLLLLAFGIAIYQPVEGSAGRYSIPAVWGTDLWIGALLSRLVEAGAGRVRQLAYAVLAAGMAGVVIANLGGQEKFAARAAVLWQTLEFVERHAPPQACVGFAEGSDLTRAEGVHFLWHLSGRGRTDLRLRLIDRNGAVIVRDEIPMPCDIPTLEVTGAGAPPDGAGWRLAGEFTTSYSLGLSSFVCRVWEPR